MIASLLQHLDFLHQHLVLKLMFGLCDGFCWAGLSQPDDAHDQQKQKYDQQREQFEQKIVHREKLPLKQQPIELNVT